VAKSQTLAYERGIAEGTTHFIYGVISVCLKF